MTHARRGRRRVATWVTALTVAALWAGAAAGPAENLNALKIPAGMREDRQTPLQPAEFFLVYLARPKSLDPDKINPNLPRPKVTYRAFVGHGSDGRRQTSTAIVLAMVLQFADEATAARYWAGICPEGVAKAAAARAKEENDLHDSDHKKDLSVPRTATIAVRPEWADSGHVNEGYVGFYRQVRLTREAQTCRVVMPTSLRKTVETDTCTATSDGTYTCTKTIQLGEMFVSGETREVYRLVGHAIAMLRLAYEVEPAWKYANFRGTLTPRPVVFPEQTWTHLRQALFAAETAPVTPPVTPPAAPPTTPDTPPVTPPVTPPMPPTTPDTPPVTPPVTPPTPTTPDTPPVTPPITPPTPPTTRPATPPPLTPPITPPSPPTTPGTPPVTPPAPPTTPDTPPITPPTPPTTRPTTPTTPPVTPPLPPTTPGTPPGTPPTPPTTPGTPPVTPPMPPTTPDAPPVTPPITPPTTPPVTPPITPPMTPPTPPTTRPAPPTTPPLTPPITPPSPPTTPDVPPPPPAPPARVYPAELGRPLGSHEEFVASLYRCVLHREPTPASVAIYAARLRRGMPRRDVITQFFLKTEYQDRDTSDAEYLRDLCQAALGREPDRSATALRSFLAKGGSRDLVLSSMLASVQYREMAKRLATFGPVPTAPVPDRPHTDAGLEKLRKATMDAHERMVRLLTHKTLAPGTYDEIRRVQREYFDARDKYLKAMRTR